MKKMLLAVWYLYYDAFCIYIGMNAFDRHTKNFAANCEDCDEVFDILPLANLHGTSKGHKIKVTEFWVTGRAK